MIRKEQPVSKALDKKFYVRRKYINLVLGKSAKLKMHSKYV